MRPYKLFYFFLDFLFSSVFCIFFCFLSLSLVFLSLHAPAVEAIGIGVVPNKLKFNSPGGVANFRIVNPNPFDVSFSTKNKHLSLSPSEGTVVSGSEVWVSAELGDSLSNPVIRDDIGESLETLILVETQPIDPGSEMIGMLPAVGVKASIYFSDASFSDQVSDPVPNQVSDPAQNSISHIKSQRRVESSEELKNQDTDDKIYSMQEEVVESVAPEIIDARSAIDAEGDTMREDVDEKGIEDSDVGEDYGVMEMFSEEDLIAIAILLLAILFVASKPFIGKFIGSNLSTKNSPRRKTRIYRRRRRIRLT